MPIEGLDVSKNQGNIDWDSVANDPDVTIRFAYLRASCGDDATLEPTFARNWVGARGKQLIVGPYHYFWPKAITDDVNAQATLFLSTFENTVSAVEIGYLPPVIDVETVPSPLTVTPQQYVAGIQRWIDLVEASPRFKGQQVVIYTRRNVWSQLGNPLDFADHPLWVADYSQDPPRLPTGWSDYTFFQYSQTGTVGTLNPVDRDTFNGDMNALQALTYRPA